MRFLDEGCDVNDTGSYYDYVSGEISRYVEVFLLDLLMVVSYLELYYQYLI